MVWSLLKRFEDKKARFEIRPFFDYIRVFTSFITVWRCLEQNVALLSPLMYFLPYHLAMI